MGRVVKGRAEHLSQYYDVLTAVAAERVHLEMVAPPPIEKVREFQSTHLKAGGTLYYAFDDEELVGWCDIYPSDHPRHAHRGHLGMGLLPTHRGRGLGHAMLRASLSHAKNTGLEKVELTVYSENTAAIALYEKVGFVREGLIRHYRKLDGRYVDGILMAMFLSDWRP